MVDTPIDKHIDKHKEERDNIRATVKARRKALDKNALEAASTKLLINCKRFIDNANSVAGYQAMLGEIPLTAVFNYCHQNNITTYLPIMRDQALMFAPFDSSTTFSVKQYGIQEPNVPQSEWLKPAELDVVLVPLVAFDATCNRIGMGGGFYDRSFELRKTNSPPPHLIGVAHALQQVDDVFAQDWDVALDYVATDESVISS